MKRKLLAITLATIFVMHSVMIIYGATDGTILSETVANVYNARSIGNTLIENIRFTDLAANHWAKEPITRLGALDIIKGYSRRYNPAANVSKEEALALLIRLIGREQDAVLAAEGLANTETGEAISTSWSKGYMSVANNLGLITAAEFQDAISDDQEALEEDSFRRSSAVSREQVAKWIVQAVGSINPEQLAPVYQQQAILNYTDWSDMGLEYAPYIEAVIREDIMVGNNGRFQPKSSLTRAELAQVIKNMEDILYNSMTIEQKGGVIGAILDNSTMDPLTGTATKSFLIRNNEGKVDQLNFEYKRDSGNQIATKDAPVYQSGQVNGMLSLEEGESIEYLIDQETNELLYIYSKGIEKPSKVTGVLQPLTSLTNGQITVKTASGTLYTYPLREGLFDLTNNTILIEKDPIKIANAPVNSSVTLTILNNVVTEIIHIGDKPVYSEISGIVKENNPAFSYITIIDWNGNEVTKSYQKSYVIVEKQNFYDESDEIGYIDEMFPDYGFDDRDTSVEAIEAGDIVHMKIDQTNTDYVTNISAKTNYVVKYGTVRDIAYKGADGANIMVTYDDQSIGSFTLTMDTPILKSGKNIGLMNLLPGDVVRMLVNQAVIEPGTVKETVKEMMVDEYGNQVASVYKGQMGAINKSQRTVSLFNTYELSNIGWTNHEAAKSLDISAAGIEYYYDGKQISLDYAERYLVQDTMEAYIVTSAYYGNEKVEKITFRNGRDSVLASSNITYSNGLDKLSLLTQSGYISMDQGTIVIKNGKIVQVGNIFAPDYAQVILNGSGKAAVVNIEPEPNNEAISVFRGRIQSIDEGKSFQVESHAVLMDMEWVYSPIPRIFNLNYNTQIIGEEGPMTLEEFIDYSDTSVVDEVFTILAEGTNAEYIVKNPYAQEGVKGQIYELNDNNIMIKDAVVYSQEDNKWSTLSLKNNYAQVNLLENSLIIKNNEAITPDELEIGDEIRIMTTEDLLDKLLQTSERDVDGYIIFVEK